MSDPEKYEAQGRAHANLKEAKATVATAKAVLLDYSKQLEETNAMLKRFIADPLDKSGYVPASEAMKMHIRKLFVAILDGQVDELVYATNRVRELQEQIDNF